MLLSLCYSYYINLKRQVIYLSANSRYLEYPTYDVMPTHYHLKVMYHLPTHYRCYFPRYLEFYSQYQLMNFPSSLSYYIGRTYKKLKMFYFIETKECLF